MNMPQGPSVVNSQTKRDGSLTLIACLPKFGCNWKNANHQPQELPPTRPRAVAWRSGKWWGA